jgi:hypothetical protein
MVLILLIVIISVSMPIGLMVWAFLAERKRRISFLGCGGAKHPLSPKIIREIEQRYIEERLD